MGTGGVQVALVNMNGDDFTKSPSLETISFPLALFPKSVGSIFSESSVSTSSALRLAGPVETASSVNPVHRHVLDNDIPFCLFFKLVRVCNLAPSSGAKGRRVVVAILTRSKQGYQNSR